MFFADSKKKWGVAGEISTCPRVQIIRLADLAPCSNKTPLNHKKKEGIKPQIKGLSRN
jgi:hypothetical protein